MNPTLFRAVAVVTVALVCYSIAVLTEQRRSVLSRFILLFLTLGVALDISSTTLMIVGSRNLNLTLHGVIGYSALAVMLVDAVLLWRHWRRAGGAKVPRGLNLYTRFAYGWWVLAYIAGAVIAMTIG